MAIYNIDNFKRHVDIFTIGMAQLSFMFSALSVSYFKIIALTVYVLTIDEKYEISYVYLREPLILVIGIVSGFRLFANVLYISKNTITWVYKISDLIIKFFYYFMFIISCLIPIMFLVILIMPFLYDYEVLENALLVFTNYLTGTVGIKEEVNYDISIWLYLFFIFFTIVMHFPRNGEDAIKMQSFSVIRNLIYIMFYPVLRIADSVNNTLNKEGIIHFRAQFLHFLQALPDNIALAINDIILIKEFVDDKKTDEK